MDQNFTYNEEPWPILIVTFPKVSPDESIIQGYLSQLETYMIRKEPIVLIVDISESAWLSAPLRFKISQWIVDHKTVVRQYVMGNAYVVKYQVIRLALQTFLGLADASRIVSPVKVFSSLETAQHWAQEIINHSKLSK